MVTVDREDTEGGDEEDQKRPKVGSWLPVPRVGCAALGPVVPPHSGRVRRTGISQGTPAVKRFRQVIVAIARRRQKGESGQRRSRP
jgi:hypothetical protein